MSDSLQTSGGASSKGYRPASGASKPAQVRPPKPDSPPTERARADDADERSAPSVPKTSSGIPPPAGDPRFDAYLSQLARAGPRNALESLILMRYGRVYTPTADDKGSLSILS